MLSKTIAPISNYSQSIFPKYVLRRLQMQILRLDCHTVIKLLCDLRYSTRFRIHGAVDVVLATSLSMQKVQGLIPARSNRTPVANGLPSFLWSCVAQVQSTERRSITVQAQ